MSGGKVSEGLASDPLPAKVALFVAEYQKDHNGAQAAIRAGYAPGSAKVTASRLLTRANVKAAIANQTEQRIAQVAHETGITLERTLREIAKGAFFDVRRLFNANGEPLPINELDDDTASVIAGLESATERSRGEDADTATFIRKYKLADRKGYLDMLMKHLGGYAKDNEVKVDAKVGQQVPATTMARDIAFAMQLGMERAKKKAANDAAQPVSARQALS